MLAFTSQSLSLEGGRQGHTAKFDQNTGQFEYDDLTLEDCLTDRRIYPLVVWEFGVKYSTDFRTVLSGPPQTILHPLSLNSFLCTRCL